VEYSQSIDIPGVPLLDDPAARILDEEDPVTKRLVNRFEDKPIAYAPVELRVAKHHMLMMQAIQKCIETPRGRQIILAPPGSAKSTYASVVGASWAMGRKPNVQVIIGSYATRIAAKQSRKVRAVVRQPGYSSLWPNRPLLSDDQRAIDDWSLSNGSSLMAAGMLAGITGNRCDLLILDDPVANREEADSVTVREKIYAEYIDTAMTRAKPWMSVILIMCMTGDTKVTMADGSTKQLRHICKGDTIATYDNGTLATAKVLNWKNQGADEVFELRTADGAVTKANARHPFLVERNGVRQWIRLKYIRTNDIMVRLQTALNATNPRDVETVASPITCAGGAIPLENFHPTTRQRIARPGSNIGTALRNKITKLCSKFKKVVARCAAFLRPPTFALIGVENCASITTTLQAKSGGCCATTATSWWGTERPQQFSQPVPATSHFTTSRVVSVTPCSIEDVFDIQVERTENFIADGFISHNTRWHEEDLVGMILPENYEGESGLIKCRDGQTWNVLCIPAEAEREDDVLGRKPGEFLWPEFWPREHWSTWRDNPRAARTWAALYQQRPAPWSGIHFNREQFLYYNGDLPRSD